MSAWTGADQDWADLLGEALHLESGQQVEHFVVGASVGSGQIDGQLRTVHVVTCCRDSAQPTYLMNRVIEILTGKN